MGQYGRMVNVTDEVSTNKLITDRGWRDGSGEKSTGRSSGGPRFDSQHPHGGSQPSLTLVLAHGTHSCGLRRQRAVTRVCTHIQGGNNFF